MNSKYKNDRIAAIAELTGQSLLADIAEHDEDGDVRLAAAVRLAGLSQG
jgi:hypothetical protein